jgi:voltage-dependent potassium channel beta subunit
MTMEYRRVGQSGLKVSAISLGAWITIGGTVEDEIARQTIHTAIEQGINFIDVADAYAAGHAEEVVGQIIKDFRRSDLVISTKAYWPQSDDINDRGLSRKHLMESVERSLKRFDIDYIDIFYCHRYDDNTPTEETVRAFDDLIRQGKVLYWGTSVWKPSEITDAIAIAKNVNGYTPIVEQPPYSMLRRETVEGAADIAARDHGIGFTVFSPLAQGILTGKYNDGIPADSRAADNPGLRQSLNEETLGKVRALTALAQEMGTTTAALALAWALRHPHVDSVITGASRPDQVEENIKALEVHITDEIEAKIESILDNKPNGSQR